jgi:hypothetical protein|tara:strand:- start:384 stop:1076 length:693 start_codon:yes stop_codon:yes gene_type:complete
MAEIIQHTNQLFDERYYSRDGVFVPSVTYILGVAYPSGPGLSEWMKRVGMNADAIKEEAGEEGTFVHDAIDRMVNKESISSEAIQQQFNPKRSLKIHRCLQAFLDWHQEFMPKILRHEFTTWNAKDKYAGTVDLLCEIDGEKYLVDYKTSKSVYDSHRAQVAAYCKAEKVTKGAILHLGNQTKKRYSWLPMDESKLEKYWQQFQSSNNLFQTLYPQAQPNTEVFPENFSL